MSVQLDVLAAVETIQQKAAAHLADVEARFQVAWLTAERCLTPEAEAAAWRLADRITARTGETRLVLLDRLVADEVPALAVCPSRRSWDCIGPGRSCPPTASA